MKAQSAIDFAHATPGFYNKTAVEQLLLLGWYLEAKVGRASFDSAQLRQCFREAGIEPPDVATYLTRLTKKKPPQLVKSASTFRLSPGVRLELDKKLREDPTIAAISKLLSDLPSKIPDLAERDFLEEAFKCYRVQAYRAAIVMVWNLAMDHLITWVHTDPNRLSTFNSALATKYPKKQLSITVREQFAELTEREIIETCRTARLFDKNTFQILDAKLARRNMAAHPSNVKVTQHQADDAISDLVNNVILPLR